MVEERTEEVVNAAYSSEEERQTLITLLLNTEMLAQSIEMALRGMVYDAVRDKWVQAYEPLINEKGIAKIMIEIRGCLNPNTIASNFEERDVLRLVKDTLLTINDLLFLKWREYEVEPAHIPIILDIVEKNIFAVFRRSQGGWTLNKISQVSRVIESYSERTSNRDKKFFKLF